MDHILWVIQFFVMLTYTLLQVQRSSSSRRLYKGLPKWRLSNRSPDRENAGFVGYNGWMKQQQHILKRNGSSLLRKIIQRTKRSMHGKILTPTNNRTVALFCKTNFHLTIDDNGTVLGINGYTPNALIIISIHGSRNKISLRGSKSNRYIAMNSKGIVYSTKNFNDEVYFKLLEKHKDKNDKDTYIQFASSKYRNGNNHMFLSIRKTGTLKKGKKTSATNKDTQFLLRHIKE